MGLHVFGDIQHAVPGGDHVVRHKDGFAGYVFTQVLVGHDGIAAVDDAGIIPPLIEHAQVHAQDGGIIHVAVHGAFIRADHHELCLICADIGEAVEHGLQHLVMGHEIVKIHEGDGIFHPAVMRVKGDDALYAHFLQDLKGAGAVQTLPGGAPVLPRAVELGGDDSDALCLAAYGLDAAEQIHEMVVRAHVVHHAEHFIGAVVVAHVRQDKNIHAPDAFLQHALGVPGGETGKIYGNHEAVPGFRSHGRPVHQPAVDLVSQFLRPGQDDEAEFIKVVPCVKQLFRVHISSIRMLTCSACSIHYNSLYRNPRVCQR